MASVEQITFRLERFGWSGPNRLRLGGRWRGVESRQLANAVLVARGRDFEERIPASPGPSRFQPNGRWSASFPWKAELGEVTEFELDLGTEATIALPSPNTHHSPFAQPVLRARAVVSATSSPAADEPDGEDGKRREPSAGDQSPLALHALLVQAQDERDEALADADRAREEATLARRGAERDRDRRRAEVDRMRVALTTARTLAEEELAAQRDAFDEQLRQLQTSMEGQFVAEREQLDAQLESEKALTADLRRRLEQVEDSLAVERVTRSRLHEELDTLQAELASAQQKFAQSGDELRHRDDELERLQAQLAGAQQLEQANARLSEQVAALQQSAAEVSTLQAQLAEVRDYAGQVEPLREELAEARAAAQEAMAGLEDLRQRMQTARKALGD